jgi:type VI secretion system secreted protein VgrG
MGDIDVRIACAPLGEATVITLDGREAMMALSSWELCVVATEAPDLDALRGADVTLAIVDPEEGSTRLVRLIVVEAAREIDRGRDPTFTLLLSDPPFLLTLRGGYRVFLEKTAEQIALDVLEGAGVPRAAIKLRLAAAYPVRPQCVQYAETEWSFIERVLADEGIAYWFDTTADGEHRLFLGDGVASHDGLDGGADLAFAGPLGAQRAGARVFSALTWEQGLAPERAWVRDLDVQNPEVYLDGAAGSGDLVYFEYPAGVTTVGAATQRASRRLDQLRRDEITVTGESDCIRLAPGRLVTITNVDEALFEQTMLIAEARHRFARPAKDGGPSVPYGVRVTLKPTRGEGGDERPHHRPAIPRAPVAAHIESAVVTGPPGEEIYVDEIGRIKARFLWDRSGVTDDRSSCWIRGLQYPLGASMLLPRVGWEVAVAYLDGSPDRPFVLGRLYNATATTPYPLPAASATTAFQTWTTPRSGATQEIRMGDDAGREELVVHAARDLSINVGGARTTKVTGSASHAVGRSLTSAVLGSLRATIGAEQTLDVGAELLVGVEGEDLQRVAGLDRIDVTGNRVVISDAESVELVGADHALLCNQSNVNVAGACVRTVGGPQLVAAALGVTESVAGGRVYSCGGARVIQCASYTEAVTGGKRCEAGPVIDRAARAIKARAVSASITAGSLSLRAGAKATISAPLVTIDVAGSLTAGPLTISSGKLKTTRGTTVVRGTTRRAQGGAVGR